MRKSSICKNHPAFRLNNVSPDVNAEAAEVTNADNQNGDDPKKQLDYFYESDRKLAVKLVKSIYEEKMGKK